MDSRICYILWFRLDQVERYAIWYSCEPNYVCGVVVDGNGCIPNFSDISHLHIYAAHRHIILQEDPPVLHNLDVVRQWLTRPRKNTIICADFLAAWNLFKDVCTVVDEPTLAAKFRQPAPRGIANKLFWGNNLPAVTPSGKHYDPIWTKSEVGIIQFVLGEGLNMFRRHLTLSDSENCQNELVD